MLLARGYDLNLFSALPRIRLLEPGRRDPRLSFARAQLSGVESTYLGPDGATWAVAAADVLRFQGTAQRSLFEGQRTNLIRNPRGAGVVVGSPGTLPTYWADGNTAGLTRTIVGSGTDLGLPYVEIRVAGATNSQTFTFSTESAASAAQNDVYTAAIFARVVGGATTNVQGARCILFSLNGSSSILQTYVGATTAISSELSAHSVTSSAFPDAATAFARQRFDLVFTGLSGQAVDITIRVYTPWMEKATFASTPTLPPTTGASTRGADLASATWSWRRGVILWSGRWLQNAPSGIDQTAFQLDDASDSNRFRIRNAGGGATVVAGRVTGGGAVDATTLGSMTAGTMTALGLAVDLDTGAYKAMLRGGSVQSGSGGPTSASALRAANNYAATAAMFGEIERLQVIPELWPSDAVLASLVNNLPMAA